MEFAVCADGLGLRYPWYAFEAQAEESTDTHETGVG